MYASVFAAASHRTRGHGSVAAQLYFAFQNRFRAAAIHNQQHEIRCLPADLKSKAAAFERHQTSSDL